MQATPAPLSAETRRARLRTPARLAAGLLAGGVLAWLALRGVPLARVRQSLVGGSYGWLAAGAALVLLHYGAKGLRAHVLLGGRVPRLLAMRAMAVGFLANNLLPAHVGELASRPLVVAANHPSTPAAFALAALLAEKMLDLLMVGVLLLACAALVPLPDSRLAPAMALVGAGIVAAVVASIVLARPLGARLARLLERFAGTRGAGVAAAAGPFVEGLTLLASGRTAARALALSAVSMALLTAGIACTLRVVQLEPGLQSSLLVLALMGVGFLLPAPPTNAGNTHFFVAQGVVLAGLGDEAAGLSAAVLVHAADVAVMSVQGVAALPGLRWRREAERS